MNTNSIELAPPVKRKEVQAAWNDLKQSLRRIPLILMLGWRDVSLPFREASLGPYWITFHLALWSLSIGFLYGPEMGGSTNYLLYVTLGVSIFSTMRVFLAQGAASFIGHAGTILNVPNPYLVYVLRLAIAAAIEFVMAIPVIAFAFWVTNSVPGPMASLSIIGLLILFAFGIGMSLLLASLAPRIRDVVFLMNMVMRFLFFVTPVFWIASGPLGGRRLVAEFNPLYHLLTIVREPLMGGIPNLRHYVVSVVAAFVSLALGFAAFAKMRGRLAFWL
jgi:ABC-type polysaccharide/polyol phosphate export permease